MDSTNVELLDVPGAAALLHVAKETVYGWVHERRIPYRKHGARVLFSKADLSAWSKSKEVSPLGDTGQLRPLSHDIRIPGQKRAGSLTIEDKDTGKPTSRGR